MSDEPFDELVLHAEQLDTVIDELREAVAGASDRDERAELEAMLGGNLLDRYDLYGDPDYPSDLDEAVSILSSALAEGPDHPDRPYRTALLGAAHGLRYELTEAPGDRDTGISCLQQGLGGVPRGEPDAVVFQRILGRLCLDRAQADGPAADADVAAAIEAFAAALATDGLEPPARSELRVMLGLSHALRLERDPDQEGMHDLDEAIAWLTAGVDDPGAAEAGLRPMPVRELGRLLWLRGSLPDDGDRSEQDAAIRRLRQAAEATSRSDADRWLALLLLGSACLQRGVDLERQQWDGPPEDLDTIVDCFTELLAVLPENSEVKELVPRAQLVAALGMAHFQRAETGSRRPGDFEAALAYLEEAADTITDMQEHLPALRTVGSSILEYCRQGLDSRTARLGVKLLGRVLAELPADDPVRTEVAVEYGLAMLTAHELGQLPTGLSRAAELFDSLVAATPAGCQPAAPVQAALGTVLTRRGIDGSDPSDIDRGIELLGQAIDRLPPGHHERALAQLDLGCALYHRYMKRQQLTDLDAAEDHLLACHGQFKEGSPVWVVASSMRAGVLIARANPRNDLGQANEAVLLLGQCLEMVQEGSVLYSGVANALGMALMLRSRLGGGDEDRVAGSRWLEVAAAALDPSMPAYRIASAVANASQTVREPDVSRLDPHDFDEPIERLRKVVAATAADEERAMHMATLGGMVLGRHLMRCGLTGRAALGHMLQGRFDLGFEDLAMADLDEAIRWLEEARALTSAPTSVPWWPLVSMQLCMALRRRSLLRPGDRARSRTVGLEGLRSFTWRVLLQSGSEDAMAAAQDAAEHALDVAGWCLDDRAYDNAVEALESGRGLVLHAATASETVAGLLREAGHGQLAEEWEAAAATSSRPSSTAMPPLPLEREPDRLVGVPSDLRYRVLEALEGSGGEAGRANTWPTVASGRLLVPPHVDEISAALRAMGADALVYLLPGAELADEPAKPGGHAVVVPADGPVRALHLPLLDVGPGSPLDAYVVALMERQEQDGDAPVERWLHALDGLCDWAWSAAVGPVLEQAATWQVRRAPRLVLAPIGLLGQVPWHAARIPADGGPVRYAVQEASFSYAASARLLCEAAGRTVLARDRRGLIVADPTGGLPHAVNEALALYTSYYPRAVYLGTPEHVAGEPGTPEQVLRELSDEDGARGAPAVVHLACHAFIEDAPTRSHLVLADGRRLTVSDLLLQAHRRRPWAGGATVTLAACTTNLTGRHHDESLTLATAFLVAGAASVVGSLWKVPDLRTSLLMFMVHHYLNEAGLACGEALRRAQLWMLDPGREVPPTMPRPLADLVGAVDCTALDGWAGFTHQGW